jgi:hypothetical protein
MQIRHILLASLVSFAACGGGSKKPAAEPAPSSTEPAPDPAPAATPPVAEKPAPEPVPAPPPAPKFALGEAKIVIKSAKKTEVSGEITLAADGTITAKMTSSVKKENKSVTAKLTAEGELTDDKGEVIARIDADGKVETLHQSEEKVDGKMVKSEKAYADVGTLDETGTFTIKKDGKKVTIDDKGKVVGMPGITITITAAAEQKKPAMFIVVAMFASSKVTMDMSGAKAGAAAVPAKK